MAIVNLEREWESLTPGEKDAVYFHDAGAGRGYTALALKVRASGSRSWFFEYRRDGKVRRRTYSVINYREAERQRLMDITAINDGLDPGEVRATGEAAHVSAMQRGATVAEMIEHYLRHGVAHKRSGEPNRPSYVEKVTRRMGLLRERWGDREASSITKSDIRDFFDAYEDRPGAQIDLWRTVSAFFNYGADQGFIEHSPMPSRRRGHVNNRERYLTDAELARVMPAMRSLPFPHGHASLIALLTARRIGEVTHAEWAEIDLERGVWTLPGSRAKNGKTHPLLLAATALALFRDAATRKVGDGRFVFHRAKDKPIHRSDNDYKKLWEKFRAVTGGAGWSAHDLRRTAATHLEALGCPDKVIKQILNHSTELGVTGIYMRADPLDAMREWLTKLDDHYAALNPAHDAPQT